MKKLVVAAAAALTMTATASVMAQNDIDQSGNSALYASMKGLPTLTIQLSGGCSGSLTLNNQIMAGIWDIPGSGSTVSTTEQMAGAVAIFSYGDDELFPIMAGSFNPGYNYTITNNAKGETFKLTATAHIRAEDLYNAILANGANVSCKAGSFADAVAKYPSMGPDYDGYLPFTASSVQFQQKSGKVSYQLTNPSTTNSTPVISYKHTVAITGAFVGAPVCSVKGTVAAPTSLSCKAGAPINVKISLKAAGSDLDPINL